MQNPVKNEKEEEIETDALSTRPIRDGNLTLQNETTTSSD